MKKTLVITTGEPAGVGPEIVLKNWQLLPKNSIIVSNQQLLIARATMLNIACDLARHQIVNVDLPAPSLPGQLNLENAKYVIQSLQTAHALCMQTTQHALVTAPVHKGLLNQAGIKFTGHTEYLAQLAQVPKTVMLMVNPNMRVAFVTTHIPLHQVSTAITVKNITDTAMILHRALQTHFQIAAPRLLLLSLNPHAGDHGALGKEEQTVIEPAIMQLQQQGINITGPASADTAFIADKLNQHDVIIAMYHDQALPAVKAQAFADTVNITLGLPYIRTSVDHGTALDIAATGIADPRNFMAAVTAALTL